MARNRRLDPRLLRPPSLSAYVFGEPISTERLVLRPYTEADFEMLFLTRSDPESVRWEYFEPQTEEEVRATLTRRIGDTSIVTQGDAIALAAALQSTGEAVADIVLRLISTEHAVGEIGYAVHPAHAGKGYATEASRPLLPIAFDGVGLHRVIGRLEARNHASARVLEKLGMRREAHLVENEWVKEEWQSELVYAILADEWRASTR